MLQHISISDGIFANTIHTSDECEVEVTLEMEEFVL